MIEDQVVAVVFSNSGVGDSAWEPLHEAGIPTMFFQTTGDAITRDPRSTFVLVNPLPAVFGLPVSVAEGEDVDKIAFVVIDVPVAVAAFESNGQEILENGRGHPNGMPRTKERHQGTELTTRRCDLRPVRPPSRAGGLSCASPISDEPLPGTGDPPRRKVVVAGSRLVRGFSWCLLDLPPVRREAGDDSLLQRGTNHGWHAGGESPLRMSTVMIDVRAP
jgi:hypothetical protein